MIGRLEANVVKFALQILLFKFSAFHLIFYSSKSLSAIFYSLNFSFEISLNFKIIGVPLKENLSLNMFSKYLLYEKCTNSKSFTAILNVGGFDTGCSISFIFKTLPFLEKGVLSVAYLIASLSSSCGTCVRYLAEDPNLSTMDEDVEGVYEVTGKDTYVLLMEHA